MYLSLNLFVFVYAYKIVDILLCLLTLFSVFVVMGVGQADTDVVAMLDVMPMAGWIRDLLLNLHSYRHLDLNLFEYCTLLSDLLVDLDRDVNLHWH